MTETVDAAIPVVCGHQVTEGQRSTRLTPEIEKHQDIRSCLIYALAVSAEVVKPALIAGFMRHVFSSVVFMRQLLGAC